MQSIAAAVSRRSGVIQAMSIGVANQVISASTNFLLTLYLITVMSLTEFGVYGIILAISGVIKGLVNSAFITQMVVLYPDKREEDRNRYVASVLGIITVICATLFAVVSAASVVLVRVEFITPTAGFWSVAVVIFSAAQIYKEFYVRLAYTHRVETRALRINIVVSATLITMVALFSLLPVHQSALLIAGIYSAAMFAGALFAQIEIKLPLGTRWSTLTTSFKEAWAGGKWALVNDIFYSARHESHTLITAGLLGPTGVGVLNAAKTFLKPIKQITPSISQIFIARQVSLRASNPKQLLRNGVYFSAFNICCVLLYGVLLLVAFPFISERLLTPDFDGVADFVTAWIVVSLVTAGRYGLESSQKALMRFKALSAAGLPVALCSVAFVYLGIILLGPVGAVYGYGLAELLYVGLLAIMMRNTASRLLVVQVASK